MSSTGGRKFPEYSSKIRECLSSRKADVSGVGNNMTDAGIMTVTEQRWRGEGGRLGRSPSHRGCNGGGRVSRRRVRAKKKAPKCSRPVGRPGGQGRRLRGPAITGIPQAETQAFALAENRLRYNHLTCPVGYTHWITSFLV